MASAVMKPVQPGRARYLNHPDSEAVRQRTLEEQRRALREVAERRTSGPADKVRDRAEPTQAYPATKGRK